MPRYLFTAIALILFLFAFTCEEYEAFAQNVSPETSLANYRELHAVKEGVSSDGSIRISTITDAPHVSHYMQVANHGRNLRAFLAPDKAGVGVIYIEQARPHKFFAIIGAFGVLPETVSMIWTAPTTLVFYGTASDGVFMRFELDLHTDSMKNFPVSDSPKTEITPGDVLVGE